jgi:long-chain fatty acid transport protein
MKKLLLSACLLLLSFGLYAQAGHIMQGVGATNMSMGGAATAQPLDINGALQWNPAGISTFNETIISFNAGLFFSSPELRSTMPTANGPFSGITKDDRGASIMPALAVVFGKKDSRHTFGLSAFGISGFGVTFPENMSNPINMPQSMGGFGHLESDYLQLQVGVSYAYEITEHLSVGIAPTFDYAALELLPNPLASPSQTLGYPISNKASAFGFGAQIGIFYQMDSGLKLGASYKTAQSFSDFEFENTYLDGSTAPGVNFNMGYPAIMSVGLGYSQDIFDFALDYRYVNYENTEGFEASGWTQTGSVAGFGWNNISIISAGVQVNAIQNLPVRLGYTYSSNPISSDLAFFSAPATAIIENAFQIGTGFELSDKLTLNLTFHHGASSGSTSGPLLSPMIISPTNPTGQIPGSQVAYDMTTDLILVGINYSLK